MMNKKIINFIKSGILSGFIVWLLVFISFILMSLIPQLSESINTQNIIIMFLIVLYSIFGAWFFYRKKTEEKGLYLGLIMAITALLLDLIITMPLIIIPQGGSFYTFYTSPVLWILVVENGITVFFYWLVKIKK